MNCTRTFNSCLLRQSPVERHCPGFHKIAMVLISLQAFTGCLPWGAQSVPTENQDTHEVADTDPVSSTALERPLQRLVVLFNVHRVSATRGAFGENSELWEIARGVLPDAAAALRLNANGFRIAVGRESDREALLIFLGDLEEPKIARDEILPDASRLVELELGRCAPWQSVFYYGPEGGLRGMDFAEASARFKIAFEVRSINLKEIWLRLVPELEEPPGPPKWIVNSDGTAQQKIQDHRHTFNDLAFAAMIPEGGFLVLAPTSAVYERPLLGRPFFIKSSQDSSGGLETAKESLYIISPIIRSYTGVESGG
ncbi:MAG: hypothetical protein MI923_01410 [Phycisphaerales bacterium]|nr:hypothetical protein [Phycisphaerales bacterium]